MSEEIEKLQDIGPSLAQAPEIFKEGGAKIVIGFFEEVIEKLKPTLDVTTVKGREEIKSRAAQLARAKTKYDDMGKTMKEDAKKVVDVIDAERKVIRDKLEQLQENVRKPLTDFEEREANRVKLIREQLDSLRSYGVLNGSETTVDIETRLNSVRGFNFTDWQEFNDEAQTVTETLIDGLQRKLSELQKIEADRAELERLRAAEAERQAKAQRDAEAEEERKRQEKIREDIAAEERRKADEAVAQAERDRKAALERAEQAERDRIAAEEKRIKDAEDAERRRLADVAAAEERERQKQRDKEAEEERARIKREEDKEHMKDINRKARAAVMEHAKLTEEQATEVIKAIASNLIPSVKIFY